MFTDLFHHLSNTVVKFSKGCAQATIELTVKRSELRIERLRPTCKDSDTFFHFIFCTFPELFTIITDFVNFLQLSDKELYTVYKVALFAYPFIECFGRFIERFHIGFGEIGSFMEFLGNFNEMFVLDDNLIKRINKLVKPATLADK